MSLNLYLRDQAAKNRRHRLPTTILADVRSNTYVYVCVCVCVFVCVCVCEREREYVYVRVCVCEGVLLMFVATPMYACVCV